MSGLDPHSIARIQPYTLDDVAPLYEAARESCADVYPWLPWCRPDYSLEACRSWVASREALWQSGAEYDFAVYCACTGRFVRGVGINQIHDAHRFGNLGYWTRSAACGQGFATAAATLALDFAFRKLNLARIEIIAAVENVRSQRVAGKVGAVREGVLRKRLRLHGRQHDVVVYSVVTGDPPAASANPSRSRARCAMPPSST